MCVNVLRLLFTQHYNDSYLFSVTVLLTLCMLFYLFIKNHQPDKNIHTVNAVKQAENRLVEWPTQGYNPLMCGQ